MKKNKSLFGFFFLTILFICSVPTISNTLTWLKGYYFRQYDEVMRKYNTRYHKPKAEISETSYAGQKQILFWKYPLKEKDYSAAYIGKKICQSLLSLPKPKEFEDQLVKAFPFRIIFSEICMASRKLIGMKIPIEDHTRYYLRPDGSLGLLPEKKTDLYPLEQILEIRKAAEEASAKFHVIVRPDNTLDGTKDIYHGLRDRSDVVIDRRIRQLERSGISVWDMWTEWNRLPNRRKLFYRTDHHWNTYGALEGARILASMLKEKYLLDYDIRQFDPSLFQKICLKKIFLGSMGKTLTAEYVAHQPDDIDILIPCHDTDFTFMNSQKHYDRGDFSIFLDDTQLNYDLYQSNPYGIWLYGDKREIRIINHKIPPDKGKKMLFIKDSYSSSMLPYLALQTREMILLEPRSMKNSRIQKMIREEKPDFVFWIFSLNLASHWE